jgi:hypothetical protein
MRKNSYESILSAVGRVLDTAEARGFSIREAEDGLRVETFDGDGQSQYTFQFDLRDLSHLLDWAGQRAEEPHFSRARAADEGTLGAFLQRHSRELVGSAR